MRPGGQLVMGPLYVNIVTNVLNDGLLIFVFCAFCTGFALTLDADAVFAFVKIVNIYISVEVLQLILTYLEIFSTDMS